MTARHYDAPDCAGRNGARDHGKHTPWPWVADADDDNDIGEFTIRTVDGDYIADIRNPYCDYHTQVVYALSDDCRLEADARLIAAAPDLLEAARAIKKIVDDAAERPTGFLVADFQTATYPNSRDAYDDLRAAIAKAEGRSDV